MGPDWCDPLRPSVLRYSNESSHAAMGSRRSFVTVAASLAVGIGGIYRIVEDLHLFVGLNVFVGTECQFFCLTSAESRGSMMHSNL